MINFSFKYAGYENIVAILDSEMEKRNGTKAV